MDEIIDTYKTIEFPSEEILFKEKGSKFFGYSFPIETEEEVKDILIEIKKQHHSARHWCYAYKIGIENVQYRVNDDGEPSNSAGQPIYGQILSFDLTNVLVIVVRYFGGVKLGVGGLMQAYKATANLSLENANIIEKTIEVSFKLIFEYPHLNKVMRLIKQMQLTIANQKMEMNCELLITVKKSEFSFVKTTFSQLHFLKITT